MTPRLVSRRYSNGRVLLTVCRNGYRNRGMWAAQTSCTISATSETICETFYNIITKSERQPHKLKQMLLLVRKQTGTLGSHKSSPKRRNGPHKINWRTQVQNRWNFVKRLIAWLIVNLPAPSCKGCASVTVSEYTLVEVRCMQGHDGCVPCKNADLVSGWDATHCSNASALQTLFDWCAWTHITRKSKVK